MYVPDNIPESPGRWQHLFPRQFHILLSRWVGYNADQKTFYKKNYLHNIMNSRTKEGLTEKLI